MNFELTQKPLEGFCCQIISVNETYKPYNMYERYHSEDLQNAFDDIDKKLNA